MGAREQTLELLKSGLTPAEISKRRGVALSTTLTYLNQQVGEGRLRSSDILYSIPSPKRTSIEKYRDAARRDMRTVRGLREVRRLGLGDFLVQQVCQKIRHAGLARHWDDELILRGDVDTVLRYSDARIVLGDLYEHLREIELMLHELICYCLQEVYGEDETGWWVNGVPLTVRQGCQNRREEDPRRQDPWHYTDLVDLKQMLDRQWKHFAEFFEAQSIPKRRLMSALTRLNEIRRWVMHPVRKILPTDEDFDFARQLRMEISSAYDSWLISYVEGRRRGKPGKRPEQHSKSHG